MGSTGLTQRRKTQALLPTGSRSSRGIHQQTTYNMLSAQMRAPRGKETKTQKTQGIQGRLPEGSNVQAWFWRMGRKSPEGEENSRGESTRWFLHRPVGVCLWCQELGSAPRQDRRQTQLDTERFRHGRGSVGQPSVVRRTGFPGRPCKAVRGGRILKVFIWSQRNPVFSVQAVELFQ